MGLFDSPWYGNGIPFDLVKQEVRRFPEPKPPKVPKPKKPKHSRKPKLSPQEVAARFLEKVRRNDPLH